jgi:hypothetical protein
MGARVAFVCVGVGGRMQSAPTKNLSPVRFMGLDERINNGLEVLFLDLP